MSSKRPIVITGALGFIGSHLTRYILNRGHKAGRVILCDVPQAITAGRLKYLQPLTKNFEFYSPSDLLADPSRIAERSPLIFHLGAASGTDANGETAYGANTAFTRALSKSYPYATMVFASSMSVYGNNLHPSPEMNIQRPSPESPYAFSKRVSECELACRHPGSLCLARLANVYGNNENHKGNMLSLPFRFTYSVGNATWQKQQEVFDVYEGTSKGRVLARDFVYVKHVVEALVAAADLLEQDQLPSGKVLMEVGHGIALSWADAARQCQKAAESLASLNVKDKIRINLKEARELDCLERPGYQVWTQTRSTKLLAGVGGMFPSYRDMLVRSNLASDEEALLMDTTAYIKRNMLEFPDCLVDVSGGEVP